MCCRRTETQFSKESNIDQGCAIDATNMTRVCSKFCSVRAYLRRPVWFGSPSKAQIPNLPCSEMAIKIYFTFQKNHSNAHYSDKYKWQIIKLHRVQTSVWFYQWYSFWKIVFNRLSIQLLSFLSIRHFVSIKSNFAAPPAPQNTKERVREKERAVFGTLINVSREVSMNPF